MKRYPIYSVNFTRGVGHYRITGIREGSTQFLFKNPVRFKKPIGNERGFIKINRINLFIPVTEDVTEALEWFANEFMNRYTSLKSLMTERQSFVSGDISSQWRYFEKQVTEKEVDE